MSSERLVSANFNFDCDLGYYRVVVVRHHVTVYCHEWRDILRVQAVRTAVLTYLSQKFPDAQEFVSKRFTIKFRSGNSFFDFIGNMLLLG